MALMRNLKKLSSVLLLLLLCVGCARPPVAVSQMPTPTSSVPPVATPAPMPTPMHSGSILVTTPALSPTLEPIPEPLPLAGSIICVDPGHGITPELGKGQKSLVSPLSSETKPRFVTGTAGANMTEEKLVLIVGLKLRDALEALGAEVLMTREVSEITIDNIERCKLASEGGADVSVKIHADGANDKSVHGVSVLIPSGKLLGTPSIVEESARLGQLMVDAVAKETGAKNRGTIKRTDLTGFNFSETPVVLIEIGYMTNPEEDTRLETEEYQDEIVNGMVDSLLAWYEVQQQ